MSDELLQLLAEAEKRIQIAPFAEAAPTPQEEIEAVLPADVLASLDEPLDDDDDDLHDGRRSEPSPDRDGYGHAKITTSGGTRYPTTGSGGSASVSTSGVSSVRGESMHASASAPSQDQSVAREASSIAVGNANEARRFFANAVAGRKTGALSFEHEGVVRRVVLRDGDLVTASSEGAHESIVHFLAARGELPREEIDKLALRLPPYGRHAGAALVAHGWLQQDQLWVVLRAHAEWIASMVLGVSGGTAKLETEMPARLNSEPSVFGASTGPAVFVELVRRAIPPEEALSAVGGEASRIVDGPHAALLAECNIIGHERELLSRSRGGTVGDLLARAPDAEIVSIVHALSLLGVLEIEILPDRARRNGARDEAADAFLDEEAARARIRARLELVDEGDYFAVLGVARTATSYEVRRAFLELRKTFEPTRILTPRLHDLEKDVRKIAVVLEEAYEILKDGPRRDRYRRAIEARP
ncbi:MAG: hypothetical protein FWD69_01750 [Polyangiaceae bacterium]|nr:hypothetical protein [Polyangiaceae bacterium]